jgi:hypothetical protein
MGKNLGSPIGMTAILLIIIGVVMAIVGIILLIANQNHPKPWYIWFLLITGAVLGIIGGIILAVWFSSYEKNDCNYQNMKCPEYKIEPPIEQVNLQTHHNIPVNVEKINAPSNNVVDVKNIGNNDNDIDL